MRGHRSTIPKWCVVSVVDPQGSESLAQRTHTNMIQHRKTGWQGCQQRWAVQIPQLISIFYTCVGEWRCMWGRKGKQKCLNPLSRVQSCLHCSTWVLFAGVCVFFILFYVLRLHASQGCLQDERISDAAGKGMMIFWLYSSLSGGDTQVLTWSLLHLLLVKCYWCQHMDVSKSDSPGELKSCLGDIIPYWRWSEASAQLYSSWLCGVYYLVLFDG